jgi:L-threonylcarbamoyladenylate synthase
MNDSILIAKKHLEKGDVIAIPTETVYGLAANALDATAVEKIFMIKQRPATNPLIVHIKNLDYLDRITKNVPSVALTLAQHFWPGPLTLVLSKKESIPHIVTAAKDTVGVRIPSHPIALALLNELDFPLAAPSANPFGYISPTTAEHVRSQLGNKIPYILDGGASQKGIESTIIGFENNQPIVYRLGAISKEEIEAVVGKVAIKNNDNASPVAPGMLTKHYSPKTSFVLSENINKSIEENRNKKVGFICFNKPQVKIESSQYILLSEDQNLLNAAKNLYAAMHEMDAKNYDFIVAEKFPDYGIGVSVNDRLMRATEKDFDLETLQQLNIYKH